MRAVVLVRPETYSVALMPSFDCSSGRGERLNVQAKLPPDAVVITTEDVGRPQENLEIYADRRAIYTTDLQRWQEMRPVEAAFRLLRKGQRVFLLLPTGQPETEKVLADLPAENVLVVEKVETIPPKKAVEWFVAAPFHKGIEMGLWEVREKDPGVHKPLSIGPIDRKSTRLNSSHT